MFENLTKMSHLNFHAQNQFLEIVLEFLRHFFFFLKNETFLKVISNTVVLRFLCTLKRCAKDNLENKVILLTLTHKVDES